MVFIDDNGCQYLKMVDHGALLDHGLTNVHNQVEHWSLWSAVKYHADHGQSWLHSCRVCCIFTLSCKFAAHNPMTSRYTVIGPDNL